MLLVVTSVGCADTNTTTVESPPHDSSAIVPPIDAAFLTRIEVDDSPEPVREFIQAASVENVIGRSGTEFDVAFTHFNVDEREGVTFLNYAPPMSPAAQRDFDQSHKDGTVIRRPIIFIRLVDGKIDDVQAYEHGF